MSSPSGGIQIIGKSTTVVEHDGLTVHETVGNVATKNDNVSLAVVTVTTPTCEPWLTLYYDEGMYVMEGYIELVLAASSDADDAEKTTTTKTLVVKAGETVFIPSGSRFQPIFPVPAKYIPLCIPAFSPERCIREEDGSDVATRLAELHTAVTTSNENKTKEEEEEEKVKDNYDAITTIYHMCRSSLYEHAKLTKSAYFPTTFVQDGHFTHATAIPSTLLSTANHFYLSTPVDDPWICLELNRNVLLERCGIVTIFESPAPVGQIETNKNWNMICPHIYGGLPLHVDGVVMNVYTMTRSIEDGKFVSIVGLVE
jgi:mannose-6-phosphate isomerase-like protein (cupin superfamily)